MIRNGYLVLYVPIRQKTSLFVFSEVFLFVNFRKFQFPIWVSETIACLNRQGTQPMFWERRTGLGIPIGPNGQDSYRSRC